LTLIDESLHSTIAPMDFRMSRMAVSACSLSKLRFPKVTPPAIAPAARRKAADDQSPSTVKSAGE